MFSDEMIWMEALGGERIGVVAKIPFFSLNPMFGNSRNEARPPVLGHSTSQIFAKRSIVEVHYELPFVRSSNISILMFDRTLLSYRIAPFLFYHHAEHIPVHMDLH